MASSAGPSVDTGIPEVAQAVEALRAGRPADVISLLEPLAHGLNASFDTLYWLGLAYAQSGRMQEARAALGQAVEKQPEHAQALFYLGQVLARQGDSDEARTCFERALTIQPGYSKARQALDELASPTAAPGTGARAAPAPPPGSVACPQCGDLNPEGYFSCGLCGRPAPTSAASPGPPELAGAAGAAPHPPPEPVPLSPQAGFPEPAGSAADKEGEYSPEQEKRDIRSAALLAGSVFGVCALVNAWKILSQIGEGGPGAYVSAALDLLLRVVVPFVAPMVVFLAMPHLGTLRQRFTAAGVIAASRVALDSLWLLVLHPLLGATLGELPFGWILLLLINLVIPFTVVYIVTVTCIEKLLNTDLEQAYGAAWAVVIATAVAWMLIYLARMAAVVGG